MSALTYSYSRCCSEFQLFCHTEDKERPVGHLQIRLDFPDRYACILAIDVADTFTRQGIASRLYREAARYLRRMGIKTVHGCLEGSYTVQLREKAFGSGCTQYLLGDRVLSSQDAQEHMDVRYGRLRAITRLQAKPERKSPLQRRKRFRIAT